jgi:hypothetical protein
MASNKIIFALLLAKVKFELNLYYGNLGFSQIAIDTNNILKMSPALIDGDKIFKTGFSSFWHVCEKYLPNYLVSLTEYLDWVSWSEQLYGPLSALHNMHVYGQPVKAHGRILARLAVLNDIVKDKEYIVNDKLTMIDLMIFSFFWQIKESKKYEKIWNDDKPLSDLSNTVITLNQYVNIDRWYTNISKNFQREIDIIKYQMPYMHEADRDLIPETAIITSHIGAIPGEPANKKFTLEWGPDA